MSNPCERCGKPWKFDEYCPHSYGTKELYEMREKTHTILIHGDELIHLDKDDAPVGMVKIKELTPTTRNEN